MAGTPLTASEELLASLCRQTFLSLWSYPRVFRDQGQTSGRGDGKEVCDLLVIFGSDVIVFSDKACKFHDGSDLSRSWLRWKNRAIDKSIAQLRGATRWIESHPERLFVDSKCQRRLPVAMPPAQELRLHRVAVATGAAAACRKRYGGTGSLPLQYFDQREAGDSSPEALGYSIDFLVQIEWEERPIHFFDEASLPVIMRELDTASDFVAYLNDKERLVRQRKMVYFPGEDEAVGLYVASRAPGRTPSFPVGDEDRQVVFGAGQLRQARSSKAYKDWQKFVYASRGWDAMIEWLSSQLTAGKLVDYAGGSFAQVGYSSFATHEESIRQLARPGRFLRAQLSQSLEQMQNENLDGYRERAMYSTELESAYVLVVMGDYSYQSESEYRIARRDFIRAYARVVKGRIPQAKLVSCLSTQPKRNRFGMSYDILTLDVSKWNRADEEQAANAEAVLSRDRMFYRELPLIQAAELPAQSRKVGRNERCHCGSGLKFKKCHGK